MTPPVAPYLCAVCRAPVVAAARFCAQCGTPFSERPPLRVTPGVSPSTPGAAVPPPGRVPVAPPPPSYGPPPQAPAAPSYAPPPERSNALLWVLAIVVLFVAALVGAYVLFAEPVDRDGEVVVADDPLPGQRETLPPPSADEGLDDGSFPTDDEIGAMEDDTDVIVDDGTDMEDVIGDGEIIDEPGEPDVFEQRAAEQRAAEQRAAEQRAADQRAADQRAADQRAAEQRTAEPPPADSPQMASAWRSYQGILGLYRQAVRRAGSSDKSQAEVAAACNRLFDAGNAVLRLPGRERYAGQITRERRDC